MIALLKITSDVISLLSLVLLVHIILGWLIQFGVLNTSNRVVQLVYQVTSTLCEPLLSPFRKYVPAIGGLDLSPVLLFLALKFVQYLIIYTFIPAFSG